VRVYVIDLDLQPVLVSSAVSMQRGRTQRIFGNSYNAKLLIIMTQQYMNL